MLLALLDLSPVSLLILSVLALLLFGERLPEVARAFGKGMMEFKKGMSGIEDEIRNVVNSATSSITESLPRTEDFSSYEDHSDDLSSEPGANEPAAIDPAYPDSVYGEATASETPTEPLTAEGSPIDPAYTEAATRGPSSPEATVASASSTEGSPTATAPAVDMPLAESSPNPSALPASAVNAPAERALQAGSNS